MSCDYTGKLILRVINISPDYEIGGISGDEFLYVSGCGSGGRG